MATKIDFTVKGTKLPKFGLERVTLNQSSNNASSDWNLSGMDLVSYGSMTRNSIEYILAEKVDCEDDYWAIPLSRVEELAKEQGVGEGAKLIGYKVPYDIKSFGWVKGDVVITNAKDTCYWVKTKTGRVPKEIVETWKPVYEEEKLVVLRIGTPEQIIIVTAKGITQNGNNELNIETIQSLINPSRGKLTFIDTKENANDHYNVTLLSATYKIGCSKFTTDELKTVMAHYNDLKNAK